MRLLVSFALVLRFCSALNSTITRAYDISGSELIGCSETYIGLERNYTFCRGAHTHVVSCADCVPQIQLQMWESLDLVPASLFVYAAQKMVELYPEMSVNITNVGSAGVQHGNLTCSSESCPSVILLSTTQLLSRFEAGDVADLSGFLHTYRLNKGKHLTDDFIKYFFYELIENGAWLAVPLISDTRILYFNKTTLDAAGMQYPPPKGPGSTWSWATFAERAVQLHSLTGLPSYMMREGSIEYTLQTIMGMRDYAGSLFTRGESGVGVAHCNFDSSLPKFYSDVIMPLLQGTGQVPSTAVFKDGKFTPEFNLWMNTNYSITEKQPQFLGPVYDFIHESLPGFAIIPPSAINYTYTDLEIGYAPGKLGFLGGSALMLSSRAPPLHQERGWELVLQLVDIAEEFGYLLNSPPPFDSLRKKPMWLSTQWSIVTEQLERSVSLEYPQTGSSAVSNNVLDGAMPMRHAWMNMQFKGATAKEAAIYTCAAIDYALLPVCTEQKHSDPLCDLCTLQDYTATLGPCSQTNAMRPVTFMLKSSRSSCVPLSFNSPNPFSVRCSSIPYGSPTGLIVMVMSTLLGAAAIACTCLLFTMDATPSIRVAQPFLLILLSLAVTLLAAAAAVHLNGPLTCSSWLILFTLGEDIALVCLFSRIWRVARIFGVRKNRVRDRKPGTFLLESILISGSVLVLDMVLLSLRLTVGEYGAHPVIHNIQGFYVETQQCSGKPVWLAVNLSIKLGSIVACCCVSFITRSISDQIADSKATMFASFSFALTASFLAALVLSGLPPETTVTIESLTVVIMGIAPLAIIVLPRVTENLSGVSIEIVEQVRRSIYLSEGHSEASPENSQI